MKIKEFFSFPSGEIDGSCRLHAEAVALHYTCRHETCSCLIILRKMALKPVLLNCKVYYAFRFDS